MRQPSPELVRSALDRPVQALSEPASPPSPPQPVTVGVSVSYAHLVADPFGQQLDVLARPTPPKSTNWAIWWSDLMMTMFIMFAALYAFQMPKDAQVAIVPDASVEVREVPPQAGDSLLVRIYEQGRDAISQHGLEAFAVPRLVPEKNVRFILAGDQLFDPGKAQIKPGALAPLRVLARALRQAPYKLTLVGHAAADDVAAPGSPSAWALSTARASALADFLAGTGLSPRAMIVVGYGDQEPVRATSAEPGLNRRAEIVISAENPSDPLPPDGISDQAKDGIRGWMTAHGQGGEAWNEAH